MAIKKRRIAARDAVDLDAAGSDAAPSGDASADAFGHDTEVLEYDLVGAQFTIDAVVARLETEGVQIVRSSPFYLNVQAGGIARLGEHKIVFKADDKEAVGQALRDAGLP